MGASARVRPATLSAWGAASRVRAGEKECGDRHVVQPFPGGVLVAAVDGLGHGKEAAAAARLAADLLHANAHEPVDALVERCHRALADTRGVVLSLASFDARQGLLSWLGVGNVEGVLVRADPSVRPAQEVLLLRAGVVGYQLPPLQAPVLGISAGDILAFATDGIRSGFAGQLGTEGSPQQLAERVLARYGRTSDDALVVVAQFGGS